MEPTSEGRSSVASGPCSGSAAPSALMSGKGDPEMTEQTLHSSRRRWTKILGVGSLVLVGLVGAALINPYTVRSHFVQAFRISSGAMLPTLLQGDMVLVDKRISTRDLQRGDIIVFKLPKDTSKTYLKRIVALPGDLVELRNKQLFINGSPAREDYISHTDINIVPSRDNFGPVVVPEQSLFVLGDNRDQSYDSRFWGFVDFEKVLGRVKFIYWSWDKKNLRVRWGRIGRSLK
jgi:signal peptidase I